MHTFDAAVKMKDFLLYTLPASGADYANLLVWSFIAGFVERFVPDTLDQLIAGSREHHKKPVV